MDEMRTQDASGADLDELVDWTIAKAQRYDVPIQDLKDASFLKSPEAFYCAARPALFIGPLIPNPKASGERIGLALVRMIKDIRKTFDGDIIYLTRGMPDGIDELAEKVGFVREEAAVMRLRGSHGM